MGTDAGHVSAYYDYNSQFVLRTWDDTGVAYDLIKGPSVAVYLQYNNQILFEGGLILKSDQYVSVQAPYLSANLMKASTFESSNRFHLNRAVISYSGGFYIEADYSANTLTLGHYLKPKALQIHAGAANGTFTIGNGTVTCVGWFDVSTGDIRRQTNSKSLTLKNASGITATVNAEYIQLKQSSAIDSKFEISKYISSTWNNFGIKLDTNNVLCFYNNIGSPLRISPAAPNEAIYIGSAGIICTAALDFTLNETKAFKVGDSYLKKDGIVLTDATINPAVFIEKTGGTLLTTTINASVIQLNDANSQTQIAVGNSIINYTYGPNSFSLAGGSTSIRMLITSESPYLSLTDLTTAKVLKISNASSYFKVEIGTNTLQFHAVEKEITLNSNPFAGTRLEIDGITKYSTTRKDISVSSDASGNFTIAAATHGIPVTTPIVSISYRYPSTGAGRKFLDGVAVIETVENGAVLDIQGTGFPISLAGIIVSIEFKII